ncbi:amidohydrolase family protein [Saccharopolyspora mangrovi]|uniref:amidohydrolase family protein n=1 Tax=Saccharopolyspora mangrovi TaxID=3082379 RepID=UPI003899C287
MAGDPHSTHHALRTCTRRAAPPRRTTASTAQLRCQIAAHAIGDNALGIVLDSYQEARRLHPRANVRRRIEHAAVTSEVQVARIAALGLSLVPQGRFLSEIGDGLLAALGRLGATGLPDAVVRGRRGGVTGPTDSP